MNTAKYIGAFAFVAMLVACSTEDEVGGSAKGNMVEINASIGEKSIFTRSNPLGDENAQKSFNDGDKISVSKDGESVVYTFNGETWTPEVSKFLRWSDGTQTFNAYYPVYSKYSRTNSFEKGWVSSDQILLDDLVNSDYMTVSTQETMPSDRKLSLSFERKTARVVIKATSFGTEFGEEANPYIYSADVYSQLQVPARNIANLSLTPIRAYCIEGKESQRDRIFYALVSPDIERANKDFLKLAVSYTNAEGDKRTESYVVKGVPAHEAGKSYIYNLKVGKDKVTIENVTVENWQTGGVIPDGEATLVGE